MGASFQAGFLVQDWVRQRGVTVPPTVLKAAALGIECLEMCTLVSSGRGVLDKSEPVASLGLSQRNRIHNYLMPCNALGCTKEQVYG